MRSAFTLLEMLVVMGILVLLTALMVPAFNSIRGGTDFTSSVYNISNYLDQARAYAMGNNTYVYVGFEETDVSKPNTFSPQAAATASIGGRIGLFAIASNDGTSEISVSGTTLVFSSLSKLQRFDNVHIASVALSATNIASRPSSGVTPLYSITLNTPPLFTYPVGYNSTLTPSGAMATTSAQYTFNNQCIQFDPQGVARVVVSGTASAYIPQYIEIGLQQTHGNVVPTTDVGQEAAIQVDGMTGVNRIYR